MRKFSNWMVLAGILLIIGGAVAAGLTIHKNLPSPFDIASASGENGNSLPIIAPAYAGDASGSATQAGAPTVNAGGSFTPVSTPQSPVEGKVPDRLVIPAINLDAPIVPVNFKEIKVNDKVYYQWLAPQMYAAGWQDSSALLGLPGNTVLNGHHNEFGKVFKDLITLNIGDEISIFSGPQEFRYQVVAKMLLPERWAPLAQRFENARWIEQSADDRITLITCWPADSNTHRVVIVAFPINGSYMSSLSTPTVQYSMRTICYDNTTMTVDQSDLDQYPNYVEGACPDQPIVLTLEKSVSETTYSLVGDVLHYYYLVMNTGNETLFNVDVIDDKTRAYCPKTTLEPGKSMSCSSTHTVTNADMAAENIVNTAYAEANIGSSMVKSLPDSQTVIRYLRLNLTGRCAADPSVNDGWQVKNDNSYQVDFEYALDGGVSGTGIAPANSVITIDTPLGGRGTGVMGLYVAGIWQNNATVRKDCK